MQDIWTILEPCNIFMPLQFIAIHHKMVAFRKIVGYWRSNREISLNWRECLQYVCLCNAVTLSWICIHFGACLPHFYASLLSYT